MYKKINRSLLCCGALSASSAAARLKEEARGSSCSSLWRRPEKAAVDEVQAQVLRQTELAVGVAGECVANEAAGRSKVGSRVHAPASRTTPCRVRQVKPHCCRSHAIAPLQVWLKKEYRVV